MSPSPASRPEAGPEPLPVCIPAPDGSCSICGDEGLEGRVLETRGDTDARVGLPDGSRLDVATDLVPDVRVGDRLVVHMGFAIAKIRDATPGREATSSGEGAR